jgi:hypothetical protein
MSVAVEKREVLHVFTPPPFVKYASPFSSFPLLSLIFCLAFFLILSRSFLSFSSEQTRQGDQRDRKRDPSMEEREIESLR